jgi:hypothetical protein
MKIKWSPGPSNDYIYFIRCFQSYESPVHDFSQPQFLFILEWSKYRKDPSLNMGKIFLQLICDECKQIILEKEGQKNLTVEKFPITDHEAMELDKSHRGHECHIEAVEKD